MMDQTLHPISDLTAEAEQITAVDVVPRLVLEICRGRTQFPRRPVTGPRFFIGSGAQCDLQLGGAEFPALHSLIQIREHGIWFETIAELPVVRINGEIAQGEWLRNGDALEIGEFAFRAHVTPLTPPAVSAAAVDTEGDLSEFSAEELVDALAAELNLVKEQQIAHRAGAESLLEAVRRQQRELRQRGTALEHSHPETVRPATWSTRAETPEKHAAAREFQADLDQLSHDLQQLTQQIEQHNTSMLKREVTFAATAEMLLTAQKQLVEQLEATLQRVMSMSTHEAERSVPRNKRASA